MTVRVGDSGLLEKEMGLRDLTITFLSDTSQENRIQAAEQFKEELSAFLREDVSFTYPFDSLAATISIQKEDAVRVFTWQLYVDKDTYKYFGFIQQVDDPKSLIELHDFSNRMKSPKYVDLSPENWYGALYYHTIPFKHDKQTYYLLFGYDGYSYYSRRKVIDVLYFDEAGKAVFGAPVFLGVERFEVYRMIFEYSAESNFSANWNPDLGIVMYDHLIPYDGSYGQGVTYVPDGSYEGLELKKGYWVYDTKVCDCKLEEPPMPDPILDGDSSGTIFGPGEQEEDIEMSEPSGGSRKKKKGKKKAKAQKNFSTIKSSLRLDSIRNSHAFNVKGVRQMPCLLYFCITILLISKNA